MSKLIRNADFGRTVTSIFAAVLMSSVFLASAVVPAERGIAVERSISA